MLIVQRKEKYLVYIPPKKEEQFKFVVEKAVKDCNTARDQRGKMCHVIKSLQLNGFKVVYLNGLEEVKL